MVAGTLAGVVALVVQEGDASVLLRADTGSGFACHVMLTSDSGALVTLENGWTYAVAGAVSSVVPPTGQLDTWVTIRGSLLRCGSGAVVNVTLAGNAARIVSEVDRVVVVVASASTDSIGTDVVLVGSSGSLVMLGGGWMDVRDGGSCGCSGAELRTVRHGGEHHGRGCVAMAVR